MVLQSIGIGFLKVLSGLAQGFAFGTGYGSGVRFGFEDVYPFFKSNAREMMEWLGLSGTSKNPFTQSGFKQASGLNQLPNP